MLFAETEIAGVWVIDPDFREDDRGRFFRAWCSHEFAEHGIHFVPIQANMGFSLRKGTMRGLHYQIEPAAEAKLIRCTRGAVYDVVVDLRPGSPTWGQWFGVELTEQNGRMLFVPELCGHGYQAIMDCSETHYMTSQVYTANACRGVRFNDPNIGIKWPLAPTLVSDQDRNWPLITGREADTSFLRVGSNEKLGL